jgi:hypothetical protein
LSENILPMQESGQQFYQKARRWLSGAIRTRIRNFLLMVILISRWFRIFNTMVRRLFYGWFISNSRTYQPT